MQPRVAEAEVHEARPGDLGLDVGDVRAFNDSASCIASSGDMTRGLRGSQRDVRRPVSVLGDPWALEHDLTRRFDPER